jgi:Mn-dependent DtxR family transcriptional regulator
MDENRNDPERVVMFLFENDDSLWEPKTIADQLGLDTDTVWTILSGLEDRDLVRHKDQRWAITDNEERLRAASRLHQHHKNADNLYGEEQLGELQTEEMEEIP